LTSVIGIQQDWIYFEKLVNNSINWLTYQPTAFVKDWPGQYDAALVIVPTIKEQPQNYVNLNVALGNSKNQVTYFVDPILLSREKDLVRSISRKGDIGAIVDIGFLESQEDTVNKLYSKEVQSSTFKLFSDSLQKITGRKVNAVMPMNGYYDENTLQAIAQRDFEFIVTDSLTDRSVPDIQIRGSKPIMIITKTARDDYEVVKNYGLINTEFQRYTYEEDVDRLLFEGGLYVFKVHSEYQLQPQFASVIKDILTYAKNKKMWITSLKDLQSWWQHKLNVEVRYETRSARRISVELNNPRDEQAEGLTFQVNFNKRVKNIQISSDIINTKIPKYRLSNDGQVLYFYLDSMKPHESRSLLVDFDNVSS